MATAAESARAGALSPQARATATIICREAAVICGRPWVEAAVLACDPQARLQWRVGEGQRCAADEVVLTIEGQARALLSAERTALNFLQLLSGVATETARYVDAVAGTRAAIVDTRKTVPGLRLAQKYAVTCGGGVNHRIGLFDAVLIKENHIAAAGGVAPVLQRVRELTLQGMSAAQSVQSRSGLAAEVLALAERGAQVMVSARGADALLALTAERSGVQAWPLDVTDAAAVRATA